MKTLWMTSLIPSDEMAKEVYPRLKTYGLEVRGHFWEDNLEQMAWVGAREELIDPGIALWLIFASKEGLKHPSIRYGLSLLALSVQAKRGLSFPVVLLLPKGESLSADSLPTPLKSVDIFSVADPGVGAKLVAMVHAKGKDVGTEYRLDIYGNPRIGQWFEVGPRETPWTGAMFGVAGGEIAFHGVGPKGSLPSHAVLNYPSKGLKLSLGGKEYVAWAVQNALDPSTSYFVKVTGYPDSIVFGPFSESKETDVYVVTTK